MSIIFLDNPAVPPIGSDVHNFFGGNATFVFTQNTPSKKWIIQHNLNRFPSVSVLDSAGSIIEGDLVYDDSNKLHVCFSIEFSGMAYLN